MREGTPCGKKLSKKRKGLDSQKNQTGVLQKLGGHPEPTTAVHSAEGWDCSGQTKGGHGTVERNLGVQIRPERAQLEQCGGSFASKRPARIWEAWGTMIAKKKKWEKLWSLQGGRGNPFL